ncbi:MAG: tRNA (N(6)-L-threonylcarbamoyladenosine(37)-C(2))-methylthiotransferase MtaB [Clostridia bacterium]|nr:tRNA (N(6)-L-threonylcarbamoyladenosine(37)-C(2))-methylthiotransferase MtaB [Clostridia bacterium]
MQTVAFYTLGCKVNQYDSQAMLEAFLAAGYTHIAFDRPADVYVVNTCTVTGTGDKKSMQAVRRALRTNPQAAVVVAGCLAQRAPRDLQLPGVRLVLGTQRRAEVVSLLRRALDEGVSLVAVQELDAAPFEPLAITAHEGRTRAVLKIQEGCDQRCTYCIIPQVRGPVRSRPLADVGAEADRLAAAGFAELVLTGIHLNSYGREMDGTISLIDAIQVAHVPQGVRRIRLGSLEPRAITPAFLETLRDLPKVCPHFHLSLQSGSDGVLARMGRRYTAATFLRACGMLRQAFPQAAITTDVMTGFPGETEEEFAQTQRVVEEAAFARMHVFPYSERAGTPAATMPNPVPKAQREERARELIAQGRRLQRAYLQGLLGVTREVLIEELVPERGEGWAAGYTPEYVRVLLPGGQPGVLQQAQLTAIEGDELVGEPVGGAALFAP